MQIDFSYTHLHYNNITMYYVAVYEPVELWEFAISSFGRLHNS